MYSMLGRFEINLGNGKSLKIFFKEGSIFTFMFYIDYTSEPMENGVEGVWGKKIIYDVFVIILTSNDKSLKSVSHSWDGSQRNGFEKV